MTQTESHNCIVRTQSFERLSAFVGTLLQLQVGQRFKLVGNLETLGGWSHWDAPAFTWSEEHVWQLSLELPAGDPVEFKIVQAAEDTGDKYWCVWQEGENTILDPVAMGLRVRFVFQRLLACGYAFAGCARHLRSEGRWTFCTFGAGVVCCCAISFRLPVVSRQ
jgi:Starch binding domain